MKIGFGCNDCMKSVDTLAQNGTSESVAALYVFDRVDNSTDIEPRQHKRLAQKVLREIEADTKAAATLAEKSFTQKIQSYIELPFNDLLAVGIEKGKAFIYLMTNLAHFNSNDNGNQSQKDFLSEIAKKVQDSPSTYKSGFEITYNNLIFGLKNLGVTRRRRRIKRINA